MTPADDAKKKDDSEYFSRVRSRYDVMSKSQRKIAKYIEMHQNEILRDSITILSRKIGISPSTISRFCQALHYQGFSDMRFSLENDAFSPFSTATLITGDDDVLAIKKKLINISSSALKDTALQLNERYIKWAADVIQNANMLHIYASSPGSNALIAHELFLQIGIPCTYCTDMTAAMMSSPHLKKGDVVIGINYSGAAKDLFEVLNTAKKGGATVIGITAYSESPIAKLADIVLYYSVLIEDDLRYRHIARMCEISIIGHLQSAIINGNPQKFQKYLNFAKQAINRIRK